MIFLRALLLLIQTYLRLVMVGAALILLLAYLFYRQFLAPSGEEFEVTEVVRQDLIDSISASGKIKSDEEVDLKFQTSGRLAWVGVAEGDSVAKWQAIASLDKEELNQDLKKELLDFMNERWDFEQTQEDYQETRERHLVTDSIKRILEKAQFDLDSVVIDVELTDLAIRLATLVSPIEGIVTRIDTPVAGVNITPATAVFTISNPNELVFSANIDEVDIAGVEVGQKALVSLDAFADQEFEAEVTWVSFSSISTSGGGTAFPAKIALPPIEGLKLGMNGDVEIILARSDDTLVVPTSAVQRRKDERFVFVVEGNRVRQVKVAVGLVTDEETEVNSGLEKGQKVVSRGISKIKDGQKIRIKAGS